MGVAIFAFLTGYVCALKPLQQMKDGNPERALSTIARSAFRRTPRLVLPTIFVTVIAWFLCQLGAFEVAKHTDSFYLVDSSPVRSANLTDAFFGLQKNLISTWTNGHDDYDDHQWTMLPLLRSSMIIFVALAATAYLQNRYRLMVAAGMYVYYYASADDFATTFGLQIFFGFILSSLANPNSLNPELSVRKPSSIITRIVIPAFLLPTGLYFASYPGDHPEYSEWSNNLLILSTYIFPSNTQNIGRFYTAIGLNICLIAVHLSPHLKRFLSSRHLLWLGRHSFAVYLTHGTLLRTLLTMAFYGWTVPSPVVAEATPGSEGGNESGTTDPIPTRSDERLHLLGWWHNAFWLVPWFALVYYCAYLWTTYVDTFCARLTKRLEDHLTEPTEKSSGPLLS